jgi:hypothetical protein
MANWTPLPYPLWLLAVHVGCELRLRDEWESRTPSETAGFFGNKKQHCLILFKEEKEN